MVVQFLPQGKVKAGPGSAPVFEIPTYGHLYRLRRDLPEMHQHMERIVEEAIRLGTSNLQLGPDVRRLEQALVALAPGEIGEAVAVSSGCSSLHAILESLDLPVGSKVVVQPNTFNLSVTPMCHVLTRVAGKVAHAGLVPLFADVNWSSTLDPQRVREAILSIEAEEPHGPGVRAIVAVALHGQRPSMFALREIADEYGLILIEDASQAMGAELEMPAGRLWPVGTIADIAFASDNSMKPMGGFDGDGGMIMVATHFLSQRPDFAQRLRAWRNAGRYEKSSPDPYQALLHLYDYDMVGYRSRMGRFHGWKSAYDLSRLERWNRRRREIAAEYSAALRDSSLGIRPPHVPPGATDAQGKWTAPRQHPTFWNWVAYCPTGEAKMALLQACWSRGIQASGTYTYLPQQKAFDEVEFRLSSGEVARKLAEGGVHIPCYPELEDEHVERIVRVLHSV